MTGRQLNTVYETWDWATKVIIHSLIFVSCLLVWIIQQKCIEPLLQMQTLGMNNTIQTAIDGSTDLPECLDPWFVASLFREISCE